MTLTVALPSEIEALLRQVAQERGVELEDVIAQRLTFSREELEDMEDELDVAAARVCKTIRASAKPWTICAPRGDKG